MNGKAISKDFLWGMALGAMLSPILIILVYSLVARPQGTSGEISAPPLPEVQRVSLDWSVQTLSGETVNLAEVAKDQVVFLNIWATWCGPCIKEMPSIDALYKDYKDKVVFVCLSNEAEGVVKDFVDRSPYAFPVYLMKDQPPQSFLPRSIPATYIIDSDRVLKVAHEGAADWSSVAVRKYLDQLVKSEGTE